MMDSKNFGITAERHAEIVGEAVSTAHWMGEMARDFAADRDPMESGAELVEHGPEFYTNREGEERNPEIALFMSTLRKELEDLDYTGLSMLSTPVNNDHQPAYQGMANIGIEW